MASQPLPSDRERAEALLERHLRMLRGYLRHLLASPADADDVAQEVCLLVLADPMLLLRGADPGAYLRGIARHLAGRHHRRVRREARIEDLAQALWDDGPPDDTEREARALARCLEEMEERPRRLMRWRYDEGLNATQIAGRLATSSDAIRMALLRIRQALARCVERRLGGPREVADA